MTNKNIEISLLQESEVDEVILFYNVTYNQTRNREKFYWEFNDAPAGKAIYVVAKDADTKKIVGTQVAMPIELITDTGKTILTAKSEDTLVDPNYRGLQIFEKMYDFLFKTCIERGIKYIWGFTTAKKPFIKLGFDIPFSHSQSLMAIDISASYKYLANLNDKNNFSSLMKIRLLCIASKLMSLKNMFVSDKEIDANFSYLECDKAEIKDNNQLIKADSKGFSIKLDLPFLLWRISNNLYHDKIYNIYFSDKKDLVANLIFNHHKDGTWYLINDTYAVKLSEKQKAAMHRKAIKLLLAKEKQNVKLIRTWDFSHNKLGNEEISIRKKAGYIHLERGVPFVWKTLDGNEKLNAADFNLSRIASQGMI